MIKSFRFAGFFSLILSALFFLAAAPAARAFDVTGEWTLSPVGAAAQALVLVQSGTTVTGSGSVGGFHWTYENSSVIGNAVTLHFVYANSSYNGTYSGTLTDENHMSGTSLDSNNGTGTWTAVRKSAGAAISLFCNRTGPTLQVVDCSVSVSDAGASPRTTPTGDVTFVAGAGMSPTSGGCHLLPSAFSSGGDASCDVQFTVAQDFPVAVAFPLEATYGGDSKFSPVTATHSLIQAGCIGDAGSPCPGAVALTFADLPEIAKNAISTVFGCGDANASPTLGIADGIIPRSSPFDLKRGCSFTMSAKVNLGQILSEMVVGQLDSLFTFIRKDDAQNDAVLGALKAMNDPKYRSQLEDAVGDQAKMEALFKDAMKNSPPHGPRSYSLRAGKASPVVQVGIVETAVKNNSQKAVKIKLSKQGAKLAKIFKAAGKGEFDTEISVKGKRTTGKKYPFKITQTVALGLN